MSFLAYDLVSGFSKKKLQYIAVSLPSKTLEHYFGHLDLPRLALPYTGVTLVHKSRDISVVQ